MKRVERLYPLSYQTEKMDCRGANRERDVVSTAPPLHLNPFAPVLMTTCRLNSPTDERPPHLEGARENLRYRLITREGRRACPRKLISIRAVIGSEHDIVDWEKLREVFISVTRLYRVMNTVYLGTTKDG